MFFSNSTGPFCTQVSSIRSTAKDKKNTLEILRVLIVCVQGLFCQQNSNNMQRFQGTIIIQTNFIHICILNYIFFSSKILSTSF
jgi:hypothetical protein